MLIRPKTAYTDIRPITTTTTSPQLSPYPKDLSKNYKNLCVTVGVQVHFKGSNTIRNSLVAHTDKDKITQRSRVIYRFRCAQEDCSEQYIEESGRTFMDRLKDHLRAPSPIYNQGNTLGHDVIVYTPSHI